MYILGDIGNSETKIYLVSKKNKILKKIYFSSRTLSAQILKKKINLLIKDYKKIDKILFCSVVPKSFILIKRFFS